jgi:hypothetical protein
MFTPRFLFLIEIVDTQLILSEQRIGQPALVEVSNEGLRIIGSVKKIFVRDGTPRDLHRVFSGFSGSATSMIYLKSEDLRRRPF